MVTIISGTNRKNSNTKKVALEYQRLLKEKEIDADILCLYDTEMLKRNDAFINAEVNYLQPASKFIMVLPEYNGSYPGVLKIMIDNSDIAKTWWHKKILLTGVSTGRAGNLRGMEHLTGSLLHLKMLVHPNRLPISLVDKLMDNNHHFTDNAVLTAINTQLDEFIEF